MQSALVCLLHLASVGWYRGRIVLDGLAWAGQSLCRSDPSEWVVQVIVQVCEPLDARWPDGDGLDQSNSVRDLGADLDCWTVGDR